MSFFECASRLCALYPQGSLARKLVLLHVRGAQTLGKQTTTPHCDTHTPKGGEEDTPSTQ